jgi:hypothetical protein
MPHRPTNRAVERVRECVMLLNDREYVATRGRELFAPDFVRLDRRRLVTQPPLDRDGFIASWFELETLSGTFPRLQITDVIAVRGDRLAAYRLTLHLTDAARYDLVDVIRFDRAVDRSEVLVRFDAMDAGAAIAEVDRMDEELGRRGPVG